MEYMRKELSAEQPDYAVCLDALSKFLPQATGMFYADAYPLLSESVQKEWNQAFLKWADTQTAAKQPAAFLRMSQAVKARWKRRTSFRWKSSGSSHVSPIIAHGPFRTQGK